MKNTDYSLKEKITNIVEKLCFILTIAFFIFVICVSIVNSNSGQHSSSTSTSTPTPTPTPTPRHTPYLYSPLPTLNIEPIQYTTPSISLYYIDKDDETTTPQTQSLQYRVYISTTRIEYYHLGEDIKKEYTCGGKTIQSGDLINPSGNSLNFDITITENDSIPDVGYGTISFTSLTTQTQSKSIEIRVNETGGKRYPDAYAIYRVEIELEPVN